MLNLTSCYQTDKPGIKPGFKLTVILLILLLHPLISVSQEVSFSDDSVTDTSKSSKIIYENPRVYNVDISFEIKPDLSIIDRDKDLKVWIPIPREWDSQRNVQIISVQPEPHSQFTDPEYGNKIFYWDFGKYPEKPSYRVDIKVRLISYSANINIDKSDITPYDMQSKVYQLYTRSENTIHITPKVEELAKEAVRDETNPYLKAQKILEFVHRKIKYNNKTRFEQGLEASLDYMLSRPETDERSGEEYFAGDCAHYSALFTAMCRAEGIPARCVYGRIGWAPYLKEENSEMFSVLDTMTTDKGFSGAEHHGMGPHMWSEFYLQDVGWIPVDANAGLFAWLHHNKIIMSKGRDILLGSNAPQDNHEGYGYQWVPIKNGRVEDLLSAVHNIGKINRARSNVYHLLDPFPADALQDYKDDYIQIDKRRGILGQIDYCTRNIPDRDTEFSRIFEDPVWIRSLQYTYDPLVCHMLNKIMGAEKFSRLTKEYESLILNTTRPVQTSRFIQMAENIHGDSLEWFFDQWQKSNGLPHLKLVEVKLGKDNNGWKIRGTLIQSGKSLFVLPVEFTLESEKGQELFTIWQKEKISDFEFKTMDKPLLLKADPVHDILKLQRMPLQLSRIWDSYPDMILIYGTVSESIANKAAAERFNNEYLGLDPEIIKADTSVIESDLNKECVILFGRPETNKISELFENIFPIRFNKNSFNWNRITYSDPSQGLAQITEHPLKPRGQFILYAGLSASAMLHIGNLYLYDTPSSYVIYNADKKIESGDWADTDPDLVWEF
ncbi:MAG: transglutaminase domain-containing protein [Bacteroidales bacterium]|nr:transglutaminase domain-containing protein [Bacteroidales bacterium]